MAKRRCVPDEHPDVAEIKRQAAATIDAAVALGLIDREALQQAHPTTSVAHNPGGCTEPGCKRPTHARGLCRPHAAQWQRREARGGTRPLRPVKSPPAEPMAESLGVRLPVAVRERLEQLAGERGCSARDLVREAVAAWLAQRPEK
jgi:hypothetical protein